MFEVVELGENHLEDAAALVRGHYEAFREQLPLLPSRYAEPGSFLPLLHSMRGAGPGVAAIHDGHLVGFLSGWLLPSFRGRPAAFSPEWAHAARGDHRRRIDEAMYTRLARTWVERGYRTHLVSTLADGDAGRDVWHWLGFGMIAVDAVRSLEPIQGPVGAVSIRRAGSADIEEAVALSAALQRHMAAAPIFLGHTPPGDREHFQEWVANPANALWLAYEGTQAVAFLQQGPANEDACTILCDEATSSIFQAFTQEGMRGRGISSALVNRALEWARGAGYERCAVDFEPMNPWATRFWLRYFQPVCYTMVRHIFGP